MKSRRFFASAVLLAAAVFAGNALAQQGPPPGAGGPPRMGGPGGPGGPGAGAPRGGGFSLVPMYVESKAFADGGIVPPKYSGAGGNVQPDFKIIGAPPETQSFAIIMHDIDVAIGGPGDVLHWAAWNIPGNTTQIEEGKLPEGSVHGTNMRRQNGYMGMGAPAGPRYHHYVFEFYALNSRLDLPATASRDELLAAMPGKVIAKAAYVGRFRTEGGAAPGGGPGAPGAGGPPRGAGPGGPPGGF